MKEKYTINRISMMIVHIGFSVCTLVSLGILIYLRELYEKNILRVSEAVMMLEHVTMGVLLVMLIAFVYDIHIRREKN